MGALDLSEGDVQAMLSIATRYEDQDPTETPPCELLRELRELIRCDAISTCCEDAPGPSGGLVSETRESDFYSSPSLPVSGTYVDYEQLFDLEHELMLCLPAGPGRLLRLLFFRENGAGFTDRDRALLTLLRLHLEAEYAAGARRRLGQVPVTRRQNEILTYVAAGFSNGQIARRLSLSEATIRKHLENIFARLQVTSRTAAVKRADLTG